MFNKLDSFLLDIAQKFCDKAQRLTGLTKFRLEKWSLIATVALVLFGTLTADLGPAYFAAMALSVVIVASVGARIAIIEMAEKEFLTTGTLRALGLDLPEDRVQFLRVALFLTIPATGMFALTNGAHYFMLTGPCLIASMYISACIPRPPSKSMVRQWYENGLTWLNDKLQPAGIPVRN